MRTTHQGMSIRLWILAFSISLVHAATSCGVEIQPPKIDIGQVREGAIAEASVRVYWGNLKVREEAPTIEVPAGVTLKETSTDVHNRSTPSDYTELILSFDTKTPAMHNGEIHVQYGSQEATIPVACVVAERAVGGLQVLVADTPFTVFFTSDDSDFDAWRELVRTTATNVNYLHVPHKGPTFGDLTLSRYHVILLHVGGLFGLTDEELIRLDTFVADGGRCVLAANAFMQGSPERVNSLSAPHGIRMFDTEAAGDYQRHLSQGEQILRSPLTREVGKLTFFRGSPIIVTDPAKAQLIAVDRNGDGFIASARHGKGEYIVISNSLICSWVQDESDNGIFMRNLMSVPVQ